MTAECPECPKWKAIISELLDIDEKATIRAEDDEEDLDGEIDTNQYYVDVHNRVVTPLTGEAELEPIKPKPDTGMKDFLRERGYKV